MVGLSCKRLVVDAATEVRPAVEQKQPSRYSFARKRLAVVMQTLTIRYLGNDSSIPAFRHFVTIYSPLRIVNTCIVQGIRDGLNLRVGRRKINSEFEMSRYLENAEQTMDAEQ
jgi:hypothetical protein